MLQVKGDDDPRIESLLTIIEQVRRQFFFLDFRDGAEGHLQEETLTPAF